MIGVCSVIGVSFINGVGSINGVDYVIGVSSIIGVGSIIGVTSVNSPPYSSETYSLTDTGTHCFSGSWLVRILPVSTPHNAELKSLILGP